MVGIGLYLYNFMIDHVQEEAALVHILYLHKKTRFFNNHCTGYEYFKDSLIAYMYICYYSDVASHSLAILLFDSQNLSLFS